MIFLNRARWGHPQGEQPGAVGLAAQDLDGVGVRFAVGGGDLPVGVEHGDVAGDDCLHDPAPQACLALDRPGQDGVDRVATLDHFPRLRRDEAGVRRVKRGRCVQVASGDMLLEQGGPFV